MENLDLTALASYWLWFGLALLLLALEAFFGSFMFLAASVAAVAVGALNNLYPYVSLEVQALFFGVLAASFIWMTRAWLAQREAKFRRLQGRVQNQSYVGRIFELVSPITDGHSSLNIDGVVWDVRGEDAAAGTRVQIVAMGEGYLQVERVNS